MERLSPEQSAKRRKTLGTSLLLSAPGPLVTGYALLTSHSTTQLADFLRRGVELAAIFIAWWVFRRLQQVDAPGETQRARLERAAGMSTAGAMILSGLILLGVALSRISAFDPGGNVISGLVIAVLGMMVNGWFWLRFRALAKEHPDPVIAAQQSLYRAKMTVDVCVTTALLAVAIAPGHPLTRYVDLLGSIIVAFYLLWNGLRTMRKHIRAGRAAEKALQHPSAS